MTDIDPITGHAYLFPNYCTERAREAERNGATQTAQEWRNARWRGFDRRISDDLAERREQWRNRDRSADGSANHGRQGR